MPPKQRVSRAKAKTVPEPPKSIDLYDYQINTSDKIVADILDHKVSHYIDNFSYTIEIPIVRVISPLGSGKTRMITRAVKLLSQDPGRHEYIEEVTKDGILIHTEKKTTKSYIAIVVPVTILLQWKEELDLWGLDYVFISRPKDLEHFTKMDWSNKIFLTSDLRFKQIEYYTNEKKERFCSNNLHLFIDEFDTCRLSNLWCILKDTKTSVIFSANRRIDYQNSGKRKFVQKVHEVTAAEVDALIKLPEIIETENNFHLGLTLQGVRQHVGDRYSRMINMGEFSTIFKEYSVDLDRIDLLLDKMIEKYQRDLDNHTRGYSYYQNQSYIMKTKLKIQGLKDHRKEIWKVPGVDEEDILNCKTCFKVVSVMDLNVNSICKECESGKNTTSRAGIFKGLIQSIGSREGRAKKVLVYCSSDNLVEELNKLLEEVNLWSMVLKGNVFQRRAMIKKFKEAKSDIYLVCNSISNSAGIHLPETTDIIVYHSIDKDFDTQIVGRGQRVGRIDSMYLHRIDDISTKKKKETIPKPSHKIKPDDPSPLQSSRSSSVDSNKSSSMIDEI